MGNLVVGCLIYVSTIAAWFFASREGIDTGPLFYIAGPVIGSLFLAGPISKAADSASQAAAQTNGVMEARIEAATARALAKRDAARTRQAMGDISQAPTQEV